VDALTYAQRECLHIAYRIHDGAADHDLVLFTPGGTVPTDSLEDDRIGGRLVSGLRGLGRLLVFDLRGIRLSDPITHWGRPLVEQWADDLAAVIQASNLDRPTPVALGDYWGPARLFAGRLQEVLGGVVLDEPNEDRRSPPCAAPPQRRRPIAQGLPPSRRIRDTQGVWSRHLSERSSQPLTWNSLHIPGTPFSSRSPRSANSMPDPATNDGTAPETRISPGPARADTRAPM
jgi:pimeloyl-ACP methyl ester carboxylesterase